MLFAVGCAVIFALAAPDHNPAAHSASAIGGLASAPTAAIHNLAPTFAIAGTDTFTYSIHLPVVLVAPPVDLQQRADVVRVYREEYLASEGTPFHWTGNLETCDAGDTTPAFRAAVLRRVNYFRAMAGVPNWVILLDEYNRKAQAAALLMAANNQTNHYPTEDWDCYSSDGAEGARRSNLSVSGYGWQTIDGYMLDWGDRNYAVGHRRWILYPQTRKMGTGDIPVVSGASPNGANALWVVDDTYYDPRPATRHPFVAWPPPGYVPYQVVYPRWSFSYPEADFSAATVVMAADSAAVDVVLEAVRNSPGDNTLVWIPLGLNDDDPWPRPQTDTRYTVTVRNVLIDGVSHEFTYEVIVFDPDT